jgi:hypothetical protein
MCHDRGYVVHDDEKELQMPLETFKEKFGSRP